jgi:hypothetical protein
MSLPTFLVFGELVGNNNIHMGEKKDSQIQILSAKISTNSDALLRARWEPQSSFCSVLAFVVAPE